MNRSSFLRRIAAFFAFVPFVRGKQEQPKVGMRGMYSRTFCSRSIFPFIGEQIATEMQAVMRHTMQNERILVRWINDEAAGAGGFYVVVDNRGLK